MIRRCVAVTGLALIITMLVGNIALAAGADLSVSQTDSKDPVRRGQKLTYEIVVTNHGPDVADGVALIIDLPGVGCHEFPEQPCERHVRFHWVRPSRGTCGTEAEGFISCDLGNMAAGSTVTVRLRVTALRCGEMRNGAFVGANNESDPFPSPNNEDFETTLVVCK